jgi:addiction module RelB/DinJ family antitoxin
MAKTTNVFARVEPDLKTQAESVLGELGIPMSNAISLYLRQIVLQRGIPFEVKLPRLKPVYMEALSDARLDAELEKGIAAVKAGCVRKACDVHADMKAKYGI